MDCIVPSPKSQTKQYLKKGKQNELQLCVRMDAPFEAKLSGYARTRGATPAVEVQPKTVQVPKKCVV